MKFNFRNSVFYKKPVIKWLSLAILLSIPAGYFVYKSVWVKTEQAKLLTPPEEVKGKIITLKSLKEDYFLDFHSMFSSTVRKALEWPETITLNYTIRVIMHEMENIRAGKTLYYIIFDNKDNKLIGYIEVREKNPDDPGQFGVWTNENYWGGGRMQEATKLIANTYFRLHPDRSSFIAHVKIWNKRSYYALKKAGFKDVGYFYEDGKPARYILEYNKK
jgi:RimJ/RimL family protein N-acetyltransferase